MRSAVTLSLTLLLACYSLCASAKQNKDLMKANYYYAHYAYHEAIPYYDKVADQLNDPNVYTQAADCYRLTNNMQKAADYYAKAVKMRGCKVDALLHYGQVLMALTQYDEAAKWLREYRKSFKGDARVNNLIAGCLYADKKLHGIPEGVATLEDFNSNGSEFAPSLWKGNLVFTADTAIGMKKKTDKWSGNAYYNIYAVKCDSQGHCDGAWSELSKGKNINIKYHDGPCTFSSDGSQMYFTRTRYKDNFLMGKPVANKDTVVVLEIMIASDYDNDKKEFKTLTPFQYNNERYSVAHPAVSPNGRMLAFCSNMPHCVGGTDIYICRKAADGTWGAPENIGRNVNTEGDELFPFFADNNTLYFSSDGHDGLGGLDIYMSKWNERGHAFSKPENAGAPLNSSYDDISLALFPDGRAAYFSSNRPAAKGGDNIYFFRRQKVYFDLRVVDSLTRQPLAHARVKLDPTGKEVTDTAADANGRLFTPLYPSATYNVTVSMADPMYSIKYFSFASPAAKELDTVVQEVALYKPLPPKAPPPLPAGPPPPPRHPEKNAIYLIGNVAFDYNKYSIKASARQCLDSLVDYLEEHPSIQILVRAHTDCREKKKGYNLALSKKRAQSVVNYLVKKKIAAGRLKSIGLGYTEPVVKCATCAQCTEAEHYRNRILDFKVLRE